MAFTPAILQYLDIKKAHPDCILFFRMGDFYETFFEDATLCSKILDIVLTSKNKNSENVVPMAGIPFHSAEKYISKLINRGYKVAIAEQTSDPIPGKIVEREVVNIITPGTYIQENHTDFVYTLAITFLPLTTGDTYHVARGDFGIGTYQTKSFRDIVEVQKFIMTIKPVELIFDVDFPEKESLSVPLSQHLSCLVSVWEIPPSPTLFLQETTWTQQLSSYGKALESWRMEALALLLYYVKHTQKHTLTNITHIAFHHSNQYMLLDDVTIKNLEILSSTYEHSEKYSLFHVLNTTQTAGGARLLRHILINPLRDHEQIHWRLDHIHHYLQQEKIERMEIASDGTSTLHTDNKTQRIHHLLRLVRDIPKLVSLLTYKKLLPSTCIKLRATLRIFFEQSFLLEELHYMWLTDTTHSFLQHLYNYLEQLLKNDDEFHEDMDFIRDGYTPQIDEMRTIAYHSDELLLQYQQELARIANIPNVKVKFVLNQWYFLEVTNKDIDTFERALAHVHDDPLGKFNVSRRNTLKGGQRYSSPYLENLQVRILQAKDDLRVLEFTLLKQAQQKIITWSKELYVFAECISWLDVCVSQALLAQEKHFTQPIFVENEGIHIIQGRHPVIENYLPNNQQFIPNDLVLHDKVSGEHQATSSWPSDDVWFLHIITWPNMGGKSTYLRQNALIVLMAHCGLFVPATSCTLGIVDAIFARIGSGDIIAKNQSTFMTEMIEVANILHNATSKSFIIFDELWRGTATYDGLAITQAILEYVAHHIGAKTLIATHYHELISLEQAIPWIKNYSVNVYETDKEVIFMKKIVAGWANKSYGIDVAKLAGIPSTIIDQATFHLQHFERIKETDKTPSSLPVWSPSLLSDPDPLITASYHIKYEKIRSLLDMYDLNNITPLQALQLLDKIKDDLK